MTRNRTARSFVVCVYNKGYPASLELRKIYEQIPDAKAEAHGLVRVIDEDAEGYLYPANYFLPLDLPKNVEEAIESAAEIVAQHR
jgi:hypothetical protein